MPCSCSVRKRLSDDGVLASGGSSAAQVCLACSPLGVLLCELLLSPLVATCNQLLDETALLGLSSLIGVIVLLKVGYALASMLSREPGP